MMQYFFLMWVFLLALNYVHGFGDTRTSLSRRKHHISKVNRSLQMAAIQQDHMLDEDTRHRIEKLIADSKIVLFMKGTKTFPQCGFSNTACRILQTLKVDFLAINVLDDDSIRQGIKAFSMWPTIPQLYINGDFIGGSDIMRELFQTGELAKRIFGD